MSPSAKLNVFFIVLIVLFVLVIICSNVEKGDIPERYGPMSIQRIGL